MEQTDVEIFLQPSFHQKSARCWDQTFGHLQEKQTCLKLGHMDSKDSDQTVGSYQTDLSLGKETTCHFACFVCDYSLTSTSLQKGTDGYCNDPKFSDRQA